jgi:hypothetical protein
MFVWGAYSPGTMQDVLLIQAAVLAIAQEKFSSWINVLISQIFHEISAQSFRQLC